MTRVKNRVTKGKTESDPEDNNSEGNAKCLSEKDAQDKKEAYRDSYIDCDKINFYNIWKPAFSLLLREKITVKKSMSRWMQWRYDEEVLGKEDSKLNKVMFQLNIMLKNEGADRTSDRNFP